ncbi:hypothetical protein HYH02_004930 [Chlamydomonas schloesseri]|uniref:Protein kinase domain-containing protein n=1 Tax=Chlamydomonas schloesseri TaxID=2026947 RepID=A0A836B895_9CHLO|nr:hypothetical protein HYH02_004930 [Chlamydomonas schloesseri]|eukprot:KAG2450428.1 hypothetical protein HYH02_004930 [Chlamydomonas schloesseri]
MKQLLSIALAALALALAYIEAEPVTVDNGAKFAAALANNNVDTIVVRRFALVLNDFDFGALPDVPIKLTRNITVRGDTSLGYWPFLFLGGSQRMTLGAGVTLHFQDIVVDTPQGDGALRAPHLQVLTFSEPGANARLLYGPRAALMISGCFGPALQLQNVQALPRAAGYPGPQVVQAGLPQPGCVNDTYAPYMKRCWPQISNFEDVTMVGTRPDAASNLQPTNYAWVLRNATAVCRALVPPECVAKLGPAACMLMTVRNSSVLATVLEPPQNSTDDAIIRLAPDAGSGDSSSTTTLAIVLGCVLGGVGLIAIVVSVAIVMKRRRLEAAGQHMAKGGVDDGADGLPPLPRSNGDDATTEVSEEGAHGEAAQQRFSPQPAVPGPIPALDLITKHTPRQPGIELDVRVAGPATSEALLPTHHHQPRQSCGSPFATGTPLACGSGRVLKLGSAVASGAARSGAGDAALTGTPTSHASLQHPTDDSVPRTFSSYLPVSGTLGPSGSHEAPAPVTAASVEEPPVLTLLPVVRGVGACGRVVEGIYQGQRVAVKLLDRGLLYHYPNSCTAQSTAQDTHPTSGAHAAPVGSAAAGGGAAAAALAAGGVPAGDVAAGAPLQTGERAMTYGDGQRTAACTAGAADAGHVALRLGASHATEGGEAHADAAAEPAVSLPESAQVQQTPQTLVPAKPAAASEAAPAPAAGAAVSPAEIVLRTQQSLGHQTRTAKPMSRNQRISQATPAFAGLTIRHASGADMAPAAPVATAALLAAVPVREADGVGSPMAFARPMALAAMFKQHADGDSATPHAVQRGGNRYLGAKHGDSLLACSTTNNGNSPVLPGFGAHAVYRNHLAFPGLDDSSLGLSDLVRQVAAGGGPAGEGCGGSNAASAAAPEGASTVLQAMTQELEVLAKLAHPNIVKLLAANLSPPTPCLVLELMDTSLDKLLYGGVPGAPPGGGLLPLPKVLHIALQIAKAFSHLHPTILHRDLKPANVLVSQPFSATPVVKLADFGLARLQETVLVTARVDVGTAAYMAPECLNALNCVVTHHADMFSFGVLLYEMLAGERPWQGCSMVQVAYRVNDGQRPPLDELSLERCPRPLRALIISCWDPVPERRPAACEVAKELLLIRHKLADGGGATHQPQPQQQQPHQHSGRLLETHMFRGARGPVPEPRC